MKKLNNITNKAINTDKRAKKYNNKTNIRKRLDLTKINS